MPSSPNFARMASSFMNSTGAPSASPRAPPRRHPRMRETSSGIEDVTRRSLRLHSVDHAEQLRVELVGALEHQPMADARHDDCVELRRVLAVVLDARVKEVRVDGADRHLDAGEPGLLV